uniref:Secreted protein n=1 Tax=Brassica oleracea var. oleracea TaxID=109376 RepID=A0A0D3BTI6_BRAOL
MVLSLIDICSLSVLLQLVFGHVFVAGSCPIHHLISFPQLHFVNVFRDLMRFQLRRSSSCYYRSSSTFSGGSEMLVSFVAQHSIFQLSSG